MKKSILVFLFILSLSPAMQGQNALATAFAKSYDYEAKQNYTEAIRELKDLYDDSSYEINLRLGWLYYKAGLYKESVTYYKVSIVQMPYAIEARLGCSYPLAALGNTDELTLQYEKVLEIDPQNVKANYWRGMIHYNKKEYAQAFKHFEKLVNLYPFEHDGLLMFAWTSLKMGKMREAAVLFNKVLLVYPSDKSALEGLEIINK